MEGSNIQQTSSSKSAAENDIDEIVDVLVTDTFRKIEESFMSTSADSGNNVNISDKIEGQNSENSDNISSKEGQKTCKCGWKNSPEQTPFGKLKLLCVSETKLNEWSHLTALNQYPKLTSVRIKVRNRVRIHVHAT